MTTAAKNRNASQKIKLFFFPFPSESKTTATAATIVIVLLFPPRLTFQLASSGRLHARLGQIQRYANTTRLHSWILLPPSSAQVAITATSDAQRWAPRARYHRRRHHFPKQKPLDKGWPLPLGCQGYCHHSPRPKGEERGNKITSELTDRALPYRQHKDLQKPASIAPSSGARNSVSEVHIKLGSAKVLLQRQEVRLSSAAAIKDIFLKSLCKRSSSALLGLDST